MNVSESMLTYRKEEGGSTLVASAWSWTMRKAEGACSATYGLEPSDRDKGNTMNVSESMLTYRKEEGGSTLVASAWSWTMRKAEGACSATYGLEPSDRDKGNTMNVSESMLTYRKEEGGSTLVASAWSWTMRKAEAAV
ncbi:hypothetical protein [Bacillus sp. FJAT-52991]|uniref:Uncharacterized protein n=1 Tax=Bacillus kandeliae TaxID=3129297 RepID=A0ABZ2N3E4_9BACI